MPLQKRKASLRRCSPKEMPWKYAANLQENNHAEVWRQQSCIATVLKSDFGTEATPQTRRIFPEHSPIRKPTEDCFWKENWMYEKNMYIVQIWRNIVK